MTTRFFFSFLFGVEGD